jgi:hypothetical protein
MCWWSMWTAVYHESPRQLPCPSAGLPGTPWSAHGVPDLEPCTRSACSPSLVLWAEDQTSKSPSIQRGLCRPAIIAYPLAAQRRRRRAGCQHPPRPDTPLPGVAVVPHASHFFSSAPRISLIQTACTPPYFKYLPILVGCFANAQKPPGRPSMCAPSTHHFGRTSYRPDGRSGSASPRNEWPPSHQTVSNDDVSPRDEPKRISAL